MLFFFSFMSKHGGNSDCYSSLPIFNTILLYSYSQTLSSPLALTLNRLFTDSTTALSHLRRRRPFFSALLLKSSLASNKFAFFVLLSTTLNDTATMDTGKMLERYIYDVSPVSERLIRGGPAAPGPSAAATTAIEDVSKLFANDKPQLAPNSDNAKQQATSGKSKL